jgi:hypothetical protein
VFAFVQVEENEEEITYETGTLLRDVNPFVPPLLLWLFPFEPNRALEVKMGQNKKVLFGIMQSRIAFFTSSVALFFTTLLITVSTSTL